MAKSVTFANPAIVRTETATYINFTDGQVELSGDPLAIQDYVASNGVSDDVLKAMAVAQRLAADPLVDTPAAWNGKVVTLDLEQATPSQVFKVQ